MNKSIIWIVLVFCFLWNFVGATYITLQADGFPFTVNESILFHGTMDANNVDVNIQVVNSSGVVTDSNYLGDRNGSYSIAYSFANADDYNITVQDLNNSTSASMQFSVSVINSIQINYDNSSYKPPFDYSNLPYSLPVTFTAYDVGDNTVGDGNSISVEILDSANTVQDSNSGTTNSDGNIQLYFDISDYNAGDYYFSVNNGLVVFPFSIYSFRMYLSLTNPDTNNAQTVFKPDTNAKITVDVMNYAGTQYISGATVDGAVYNSSNVPQSALSFSSTGGSYYAVFTAPSTLGDYYLDINVSYGGTTQSQKISFKVQNYSMEVISHKFEGGGMGEKEKMPSVFPTSSTASLELHFAEINASELTNSQLTNICNNGSINDHNFVLYYKKVGANDWNAILTENDISVSLETGTNYCTLSFQTPATPATYYIKVEARDLNVLNNTLDFSEKTMITVQDYLVFLEPVDPSTCDTTASDVAASCGFKFQFTLGERIGLRPTIIDLNSSTSENQISSLSGAIVFRSGSETQLLAPIDINYRSDLNIIEINDSNTVQNLSGGFYSGGFFVDIDSNGQLAQSNVTAFGFFYLKVLNVTTTLVDVNGNSIATHGPPTYANNKNIYVKVTVKDSDGSTAIRGAVVRASRLMNFFERKAIDVSSVDSNSTNSNGIATITLDYNALGIGSGEFMLELDINAATLGKTDTAMTFFERRNFYLEAMPINKSDCSSLPMVSGDMNSTFLLEAKDAWMWQVLNDLNVTMVKVFYEGTPTNPLSMPVEKTVASFKTGTINCNGEDYNYVDVNHNGTWEQGFYKFQISVNSATKGNETTNGFIMVQPFFIVAIPAASGELAEYAEPGARWDFNIMSEQDVNITAKLIDLKNWNVFASDLNLYHKATGVQIAGTNYNFNDVNAGSDYNTIQVAIPSNLPIAKDIEMDGYILQIDANNGSETAELELFIVPQKWQVLTAKAPEGEYTRGEPGPFFFWITGDDYRKMLVDSNVEDNCIDINEERGYTNANITDANLAYSRIVMVRAGEDDVNGTQTDWNAIILINPDTEQVWVDRDNDCNFNEEPDINALTVGSYVSGITSNMMYQDWSKDGNWFQHPYNGIPIITGITKSKLFYSTDAVVSAMSLDNPDISSDPFIGTTDTDHDFGIPVVVRDLNGQAAVGVTVSIQSVMLAEMGGGMPTALSASDYNSYDDTTDANGLALPKIAINNAGIILVGLKVSNGATQTIMPWNGAIFQTKPYTVVLSYGLEDLNIQFDQNALALDVNTDAIPLACFNPSDTNIGVLNEKSFYIESIGSNVIVNFDNDINGSQNPAERVPITDENWYFIPLTGHASCPNAMFGSGVARLIIDDDRYINLDVNDGQNEYALFNGPGDIGSANAVNATHLDLNEITIASASAFPICLYGPEKCSGNDEGYNPGAYYDLNKLADNNIIDGNLLIYNLFDYSDNFYNPATYGSDSRIREYLRLEVRGMDYNYVQGAVSVTSGSVFNEQTGLPVISSFTGRVPSGAGYRVLMDGNFTPTGEHGTGFMVSIDTNYNGDVVPTFGFMWSRKP